MESNTFSPWESSMDNFYKSVFVTGSELQTKPFRNELDGFFDAAEEADAQIVPTFFGNGVAAGTFKKEAFQELLAMVTSSIEQAGHIDGVYYLLHGAMVAEGCDDVEGAIVSEIRRILGPDIPIVITLDAHANVTQRMVQHVNGIVGYRTYPHVDYVETGYRAGKLLFSILRGEVEPVIALQKVPMIVPAENSQSSHGPFADLLGEAARGIDRGDALITSLFPVQPWLDIDELGFGVVVVGTNEEKAHREANRIARLAWEKRYEFDVELCEIADIVSLALQEKRDSDIGSGASRQPFIVSDSADSAGAGSTGDSNYVLKRLLELGVENELSCLVTIADAPAVDCACHAGVGAHVELSVGYTLNLDRSYGQPLKVTGEVMKIDVGRFMYKDAFQANFEVNMGRCAVIRVGLISLLLTERTIFNGDPNYYRSMGLEPQDADLVQVKSANQFRAAYGKISKRIYILDSPGCSSANLRSFTFHNIQRPFFPFDDHFEW